jgi:shikimate dehydrogenase
MGGVTKKIYGILGCPVAHSLSPAMHNAAFEAEGMNAEYRFFEISPDNPEALANFCYETELNNTAGFSVTMPYKKRIMTYLDHYDPLAKTIGSVNTVVNENAKLTGYNTDTTGAITALREKTTLPGKRVLLLGAGGAARAIAYGLKTFGADVHVWSRITQKAEALADEFEISNIEYRHITSEANFDVIVNTTPVGSQPDTNESLLRASQIKKGCIVMDIITVPVKTQLLQEAEKAEAKTITGERMLLHQAAGQFEIWFRKTAPLQVMEKALYASLNESV